MNTNQIIRKSTIFAAIILIASLTVSVKADELKNNNPYTVLGHQLRSNLITQSPFGDDKPVHMGPTLFQEVIPCRFVSTLETDAYPAPWGGKAFLAHENRTYYPIGVLATENWVNPCSEVLDSRAIAVALRVMAFDPEGNGAVFVAPSNYTSYSYPAVQFKGGVNAQREADVALMAQSFRVQPDEAVHLVIDIIGYFIPDPDAMGSQGERGEKGDKGEQGLQGERGEKGDRGEAGAQGLQGEKGDKGERGEAGAQGLQGDKGDKGERGEAGAQGLQGDKGDKGDRGEAGAQGLQGDKGDKGERGEAGAQGLQGDKGDKGDRGEAGAQGLQGDKGERGDRGEAGAQGQVGPQGPMGPMGPQGPKGDTGPRGGGISMIVGEAMFPPPGQIQINEPAARSNSVIILIYTEVSNGNALGIQSQSNGSFVATGSPNKPFKYIILNQE